MAGNTFGQLFRITSYGESHGDAIGVVIDGCPAGLKVRTEDIQRELNRRKPGQSDLTSPRNEEDECMVISGVYEGKTLGTPIHIMVRNGDAKRADYQYVESAFRPSHADFTYEKKYGHRDPGGGGRSSARETIARVAAGAIAKLLLAQEGILINAYVTQVGPVKMDKNILVKYDKIDENPVKCPDEDAAGKMIEFIREIKQKGDSIGGIIQCDIRNCPVGLGEPVFDKLHADLGKAMLSINAVKGFDYGTGFEGLEMTGSQANDVFVEQEGAIKTVRNHSGGIQGGISNGMPVYFRVAFKPVATIMSEQRSVNNKGETVVIPPKGRHDPCVLPRAAPIVEAMAALVLADHFLRHKTSKL